jgi:hypothetical protein|tara:strand:+ start:511 stop:714 length:204 start_codon:yes stop_codon:yes gene_type:complete
MKYKIGDLIKDDGDNALGCITDVLAEIKNEYGKALRGPWFKVYWLTGGCEGFTTESAAGIKLYKIIS